MPWEPATTLVVFAAGVLPVAVAFAVSIWGLPRRRARREPPPASRERGRAVVPAFGSRARRGSGRR